MKICIIGIMNIKHMSLISLYTKFFNNKKIDFDIIYVDKYGVEEKISAKNIYRYKMKINSNWSRLRKMKEYLKFKKYAESIIVKNNYDYIIVWRSETALLLSKILLKHFKNKYIVNIRDYCGEKNLLIRLRMKKVLGNSLLNTISSSGFKSFLPSYNLTEVHSFNETILNELKPRQAFRKKDEPIRVCFIGYVRFFENDKKLIKALGNDSRYIIQFFGSGSEELKNFALDNKIKNVEFVDKFSVEETGNLLERADVINNLYGRGNIALDTAISIKYYYALYLNLPILVYQGTYMDTMTKKSGIGFSVDGELENIADQFYEWYHKLNFEEFKTRNSKELKNIKAINMLFNRKIHKIFVEK